MTAVNATEEGRLVAAVMGDRRSLEFEGQKYRFVIADRVPYRSSGRDEFRLVPALQAQGLLARMSERLAKTPEQRASWEQLAEKLTDGRSGVGVILTRSTPASGGGGSKRIEVPAMTPSQVNPRVAQQDWVEVVIEYEDGGSFDANCVIELPGGRRIDGPPDPDGVVRVDGIDPGSCKLSFPKLDANAWRPA